MITEVTVHPSQSQSNFILLSQNDYYYHIPFYTPMCPGLGQSAVGSPGEWFTCPSLSGPLLWTWLWGNDWNAKLSNTVPSPQELRNEGQGKEGKGPLNDNAK